MTRTTTPTTSRCATASCRGLADDPGSRSDSVRRRPEPARERPVVRAEPGAGRTTATLLYMGHAMDNGTIRNNKFNGDTVSFGPFGARTGWLIEGNEFDGNVSGHGPVLGLRVQREPGRRRSSGTTTSTRCCRHRPDLGRRRLDHGQHLRRQQLWPRSSSGAVSGVRSCRRMR